MDPISREGRIDAGVQQIDLKEEIIQTLEKESDPDNSFGTNWSNESILGSSHDSWISESPTRISESEEEKVSPREMPRAGRRSGQHRNEQNDRIRRNGDSHHESAKLRTSGAEDGKLRSDHPSRERGQGFRTSSPPLSYDWGSTFRRARAKSASSRTTSTGYGDVNISPFLRSRLRQGSTHSGISLPGYSQIDEDEWETAESPGRDQQNQHNEYLLDDTDPINDECTDMGEESQSKGAVNWLWICQTDVVPGYFATPWQSHFSESACFGGIAVMLEALQNFTDASTLRYVERQPHCEDWVYKGNTTYPSYAINAMGGLIVSGKYKRVKFDAFRTLIPPIELLRSYDDQVNRSVFGGTTRTTVERLGELMALDSWLSFCGRLPEICNGRKNLLQSTPALVQKIMTDFEYEFMTLDRTATEGGLQIIQETAELVVLALEKEMLSEGEQLFAVVAMLRAAKMALCVVQGPSTVKLRDIILQDVQVYLV
jgi:hypothetical protein